MRLPGFNASASLTENAQQRGEVTAEHFDGVVPASCDSDCEAKFGACVAAAGIFAPFLLPLCFSDRDRCRANCRIVITPVGVRRFH